MYVANNRLQAVFVPALARFLFCARKNVSRFSEEGYCHEIQCEHFRLRHTADTAATTANPIRWPNLTRGLLGRCALGRLQVPVIGARWKK